MKTEREIKHKYKLVEHNVTYEKKTTKKNKEKKNTIHTAES